MAKLPTSVNFKMRRIMPNVVFRESNEASSISQTGIDLITHFEGVELESYKDSGGIWTIGYGTTRYPDDRIVKEGDKITLDEAKYYFSFDLKKFTQIVLGKIKRPLKQQELDALVSFCYNAGTSYKLGGQWKDYNIWKLANNNTITKQYWEALAITANGVKLNGLIRRRKSESMLYFDGIINFFE